MPKQRCAPMLRSKLEERAGRARQRRNFAKIDSNFRYGSPSLDPGGKTDRTFNSGMDAQRHPHANGNMIIPWSVEATVVLFLEQPHFLFLSWCTRKPSGADCGRKQQMDTER